METKVTRRKIILPTIDDVKSFVNIMNRCPKEAICESGKYRVDAKSIMGIFSLDLMHPITLVIEGAEDEIPETLKELDIFDFDKQ